MKPLLIIILAAAVCLTGCVYGHLKTPKVEITYLSVGKDIVIEPNGVVSNVSPRNENIIWAIGGAVAGWIAK